MRIKDKLKFFQKCLKIVYEINEFDFYSDKEIYSFDNYGY